MRAPANSLRSRLRASAALALAAALALPACSKREEAPAMPMRPPAPVRVATAIARDVPVYLDEIGRVHAIESVSVRPQVAGRVTEVRFAEGADVAKGDVLVTIDSRPFQAKLAGAEADVLRARAALARAQSATLGPRAALDRATATRDLAKTEFARAESLLATNAISRADHDAKKSALVVAEAEIGVAAAALRMAEPDEAQAQAEVKRAEADVEAAKIDVDWCTVRAPIAGRAGRRLVDAGNVVEERGDPLVMLDRLDEVHVDFSVAEKSVPEVRSHLRDGSLSVDVRIPGDTVPHTGTLTFIDSAVDAMTGTLRLRATLKNPDRALWPGSFVQVRLVLATLKGAVLVPAGAEQVAAAGTFVYVVADDGTAAMRPVAMGQRQGDLVVVAKGVNAGERVVIEGQFAVTPGGKVNVLPETQTASAAPAAEQEAR